MHQFPYLVIKFFVMLISWRCTSTSDGRYMLEEGMRKDVIVIMASLALYVGKIQCRSNRNPHSTSVFSSFVDGKYPWELLSGRFALVRPPDCVWLLQKISKMDPKR